MQQNGDSYFFILSIGFCSFRYSSKRCLQRFQFPLKFPSKLNGLDGLNCSMLSQFTAATTTCLFIKRNYTSQHGRSHSMKSTWTGSTITIYGITNILNDEKKVYSGARALARQRSTLLSKLGNLTIQEIFGCDVSVRPPARPPYRVWGGGGKF